MGLQWLIGKVTSNIYIIVGLASLVFSLAHIPFGSGGFIGLLQLYLVFILVHCIEGMSLLKLSLFHFPVNFPGQFVNNEIDFGDMNDLINNSDIAMMIYGLEDYTYYQN